MSEENYELIITIKDKSTNLNSYGQEGKLQELIDALKLLGLDYKFDFEIVKKREGVMSKRKTKKSEPTWLWKWTVEAHHIYKQKKKKGTL